MFRAKLWGMVLVIFLSVGVRAAEVVRISAVALKNFGDSKAEDAARLEFIANRIAEQALKGVCVVDELQDKDGSAMDRLHEAVGRAICQDVSMELSDRVGGGRKEQFGFFWNPALLDLIGEETFYFDEIQRDPSVATFRAKGGFDFTLCAFHTRPAGSPLRKELDFLDDVFQAVQDADPLENDVIFLGDFNAPPERMTQYGQNLGILDTTGGAIPNVYFVIRDRPTNVRRNKLFDNIFFDALETDEYIPGPQHVLYLDQLLDEYPEEIDDDDPEGWLLRNVMDHCPVYAHFWADRDTD